MCKDQILKIKSNLSDSEMLLENFVKEDAVKFVITRHTYSGDYIFYKVLSQNKLSEKGRSRNAKELEEKLLPKNFFGDKATKS